MEVRLGVVEYGNLKKVQVLEGEGVGHAASGVEGPVRDVLVSGGGVGVAGSFSDDPVVALLLQTEVTLPLFRLFS